MWGDGHGGERTLLHAHHRDVGELDLVRRLIYSDRHFGGVVVRCLSRKMVVWGVI